MRQNNINKNNSKDNKNEKWKQNKRRCTIKYSKHMTKTIKFHYVLSDSPHDTVLIKNAAGPMNYYEVNSHQWARSNYGNEVL